MGSSARNDDVLPALLWEARHTCAAAVNARLSADGFDDISDNAWFLLHEVALRRAGVSGESRKPAIMDQSARSMAGALVSRGYLACRINPDNRRQVAFDVTERGRAALAAIWESICAERWAGFSFRQGDIVISTPLRSGTTWMQMICALLVFGTPDIPASLPDLSPWLDQVITPRDAVYGRLAAQRHRRIMKTHRPVNEIPLDPRATYIVVARQPLDCAVSTYYYFGHDRSNARPMDLVDHIDPGRRPSLPIREWLVRWIDAEPPYPQLTSLPGVIGHLSAAWARRESPNVVLIRYEDLCADLESNMRYLAARLGFKVPDVAWPGLVKAATFEQMRAAARRLQPTEAARGADFFRRGTSGSGREVLAPADLDRYIARLARLAPSELLTWLHR